MLGYAYTDMLRCVVRNVPSANEIIMDGLQRGWKHFARADELTIEFLLDTIMSPAVLAACCQLDEGGNLSMENGEICTTGTGIAISLGIGALRCMQIIFGLCQINLPVHTLSVCYDCGSQLRDGFSALLLSDDVFSMACHHSRNAL
jgi:hypothetical protein